MEEISKGSKDNNTTSSTSNFTSIYHKVISWVSSSKGSKWKTFNSKLYYLYNPSSN